MLSSTRATAAVAALLGCCLLLVGTAAAADPPSTTEEPVNGADGSPLNDFHTYGPDETANMVPSPLLTPPNWDLWHHSLQTFENKLEYSLHVYRILWEEGESKASGTLMLEVENQMLSEMSATITQKDARRSETTSAVDQFIQGIAAAADKDATALLQCAYKLQETICDLYDLIAYGVTEQRVMSTLSVGWSAVKQCVDCVSSDSEWFDVFVKVIHAYSTAVACYDIVEDLEASGGPDWYMLGQDVFECAKGLVRRDEEAAAAPFKQHVPQQWTCDPTWYNHSVVCNINCGVFDPDCTNRSVSSVYVHEDSPAVAPAEWKCLPRMYQDGKICDTGCGSADPDCADASLPLSAWHAPELIFAIDHMRHEVALANGAPSTQMFAASTSVSGNPSEAHKDHAILALSIVAAVACIAGLGLLAALLRERRARLTAARINDDAAGYRLMANEEE